MHSLDLVRILLIQYISIGSGAVTTAVPNTDAEHLLLLEAKF
jgi:hypothetical protein